MDFERELTLSYWMHAEFIRSKYKFIMNLIYNFDDDVTFSNFFDSKMLIVTYYDFP